jgi:hypothetical protein
VAIAVNDGGLAFILHTLRAWDDNDDEASRPARLAELAALLSGTNALELVGQLPPELMGYAFAVPAVREKLLADPAAALAWMSEHSNVAGPQLSTYLHDWGQKSPDEMAQYLTSLPEGGWKQTVIAKAASEALARDPVAAIEYARQLNAGPAQTSFMQMATADWARQNPDAAQQWVGQISDPALRDQLTGAVLTGYAEADPGQAMQLAAQSLSPGPVADQAQADIAWKWALQDPSGAGDYLAQMPAGNARQMAVSEMVNVWANHDPTAAVNWIEGLSDESLQMEAAKEMRAGLPEEGK